MISERIPYNMTAQKAIQTAQQLQGFIDSHPELTQSKVAKMIDVSPAQLNQYLKGKYKGNLEDITNKIINLISSISRREHRAKNSPYIETSVARKIGTLITQTEAFSDSEGKIGLIVGDGGHGKSHCLRQYAAANRNTIYVELDDAMNSTMIFSEIAKKLRIDASGSMANVTRRVIDALAGRHVIIMLDEASSLTVKQLNQLRQIIVVKSRCPLILAGNADLLKTVLLPTTRRGYESLDQFTSRLMQILNLDEAASNKDGGVYTVEDIRRLYEYGGIRLTSDGVRTLRKICQTPRSGRLRTCSHVIAALHASRVTTQRGEINTELIAAAIEELDLPVRVRLPIATFNPNPDEIQTEQVAKAG